MCKGSVTGPRCDECMDGHFNLQSSNPDGCTECFCFGKSTQCSSKPGLFRNKVRLFLNNYFMIKFTF